ncbi:hypothetical protein Aduo_006464 [Ancylostoma duodenale]
MNDALALNQTFPDGTNRSAGTPMLSGTSPRSLGHAHVTDGTVTSSQCPAERRTRAAEHSVNLELIQNARSSTSAIICKLAHEIGPSPDMFDVTTLPLMSTQGHGSGFLLQQLQR